MYKEVTVRSVVGGMSETGSFVLMLGEVDGCREVPVVIGPHEAQGLLLARGGVETRRPTTHELMKKTLDAFGLSLTGVSIDKVREGVFYATLKVSDGFNEMRIDSRATDAVTLALLSEARIEMAEEVLEEAGVKVSKQAADSRQQAAIEEWSLEELEEELRRCEEAEDYERAAEIQRRIEGMMNDE